MTYDPMAASLAVRLTRAHVTSARPDAPVAPKTAPRSRLTGLRARLATDLVALARRVEPAEPYRRPSTGACQPG